MMDRRPRRNEEPFACTLYDHAAPIQRIDLAACQVKPAQAIQSSGNRRLRYIEARCQAANRMGTIVQIAGQEDAKLTRGEIDPVSTNQRDDGIAEKAHLGVRNRVRRSCHVNYPFLGQVFAERRSPASKLSEFQFPVKFISNNQWFRHTVACR